VPEIESAEQQNLRFVDKIFSAAQASAVFSAPVTTGGYTVITASEVAAGGGFGSGQGSEPGSDPAHPAAGGGGSGGGGGSTGRPVAVIVVGPDGVQVKPIFDVTKFGLAVLTAWAAMLATALRLKRASR
jgi:uncharacterized spore protein YtfJ